ncbi:MAG: RNA 3'-terminal phosphate cyclase [candidate division WOR-3 bacterium]
MIEIDGSFGSGGGQILRTSLALSVILRAPIRIKNIRARRPKPGLMPQHLAGVRAAAKLSRAKVEGDFLGSTELVFEPAGVFCQDLTVDVAGERGSAGAVTLVAQTLLPIMLFSDKPCQAVLRGGTHVPFSPVYEYLERVLLPFLERLGFKAEAKLNAYGFYPVGGGEVVVKAEPVKKENLKGLEVKDKGGLKSLRIVSGVANLPVEIAQRQAARLKQRLGKEPENVEVLEVKARCPGTYLFLEAVYQGAVAGFSSLGKKGKRAEQVADEVYELFERHQEALGALDPNLSDQIIPFLGLSKQDFHFTTTRVSDHLLTNIEVVKRFIPELNIELKVKDDGFGEVRGRW